MKKPITQWVVETFDKKPLLTEQKFNVSIYPSEKKSESVQELEVLGFKVALDNNGNSLEVKKK